MKPKILLFTSDKALKLEGIPTVEEVDDISKSIILLDIDSVGFSVLPDTKEENILIAITNKKIPGYVMKLISLGFYDVIFKPIDPVELQLIIDKAKRELDLMEEIIFLPKLEYDLSGELCKELCSIIGGYGTMKEILKLCGRAAISEVPILIIGESGTGKELFAKAIWKLSPRWQGPFIAVNCSAIPEHLLEAELFGYEKGAFTGATISKKGLFEEANHGILFLDEIGELPLSLQPKLLRVLQDKKLRRLGGTKEVRINFRLISATNRDLKSMVQKGEFREDLYYRLSVIEIHIPPLRKRKEDIPELINCILNNISKETGKKIKGYTRSFLNKLLNYSFPGNVRELENILRRAVTLNTTGILTEMDLKINSYTTMQEDDLDTIIRKKVKDLMEKKNNRIYHSILERVSRIIIDEAMIISGGNQVLASKLLGINRITLRKKIENKKIE